MYDNILQQSGPSDENFIHTETEYYSARRENISIRPAITWSPRMCSTEEINGPFLASICVQSSDRGFVKIRGVSYCVIPIVPYNAMVVFLGISTLVYNIHS